MTDTYTDTYIVAWVIIIALAIAVFYASSLKPARKRTPVGTTATTPPSETTLGKIRKAVKDANWGKPIIGLVVWVAFLGMLWLFQEEIPFWNSITSNAKVFVGLNLAILTILLAWNFGGGVARLFSALPLALVILAQVGSGGITLPASSPSGGVSATKNASSVSIIPVDAIHGNDDSGARIYSDPVPIMGGAFAFGFASSDPATGCFNIMVDEKEVHNDEGEVLKSCAGRYLDLGTIVKKGSPAKLRFHGVGRRMKLVVITTA